MDSADLTSSLKRPALDDKVCSDDTPSPGTAAQTQLPPPAKVRRVGHRSHRMITEDEVGIVRRVASSSVPRFNGILKQRYSDFLVNEITRNGDEVHLSELAVPVALRKPSAASSSSISAAGGGSGLLEPAAASFSAVLSPAERDRLAAFLKAIDTPPPDVPPNDELVFQEELTSKDARKQFHQLVKDHLPVFVSDTVITRHKDGTQTGLLRIRHKRICGKDERRDGGNKWPADLPSFCHFTLFKINYDSMGALALLARKVGVPIKMFNVAGTKDKRGVTCQRVSVQKVFADNLAKTQLPNNIRVGNFCYQNERIALGDLKGNRFEVVLRQVEGPGSDDAEIHQSLTQLKESGFINYFGMQRFGTTSIPTYTVGLAALNGEWKKAIDAILASRFDMDSEGFKPAYDAYLSATASTGDLKSSVSVLQQALKTLPRWFGLEKSILEQLCHAASPLNYSAAFDRVPRQLRMMYLHSLQSYTWNFMTSKRFELYGNRVVKGDLVLESEGTGTDDFCDDEQPPTAAPGEESLDSGNATLTIPRVKVLETDADVAQHSIFDVVMPIPGPSEDVCYPSHEVNRSSYEAFLTGCGGLGLISNCSHAVRANLAVRGGYRRICIRPEDLSWKIIRHNSPQEDLTENDLDRITKPKACGVSTENAVPTELSAAEGKLKAVSLRFILPSGTYATMLVREVCNVQNVEQQASVVDSVTPSSPPGAELSAESIS